MASEIDLPWSYLGGSEELIAQVVDHPELEALPAQPDDCYFLRAPAWLEPVLRAAVEELLRDGDHLRDLGRSCARDPAGPHPSARR